MEERTKTIIISIVLFLASVGVFYYLDLPQYKLLMDKENQITQVNENISSKRNYNDLINQQAAALEDAGWLDKRTSIEINFADPLFFIPKMQYFFRTTTANNGLVLNDVTYSPASSLKAAPAASTPATGSEGAGTSGTTGTSTAGEQTASTATSARSAYFDQIKGPVMKTTFNLAITGSYNAFKNFLKEIEGQTRIITVSSITLTKESGAMQTGGGAGAAAPKTFSPNELPFKLVVDAYSY